MSAPAEGEKFVIQMTTVHVKPKYYMSYLSCIPKGIELVKKHGGHPIHEWIVEAGGGPEVIFMVRWPSIDAKMAASEAMFKDPDFHAYMKEQARKVYCVDDKICMRVPIFPINPVDNKTKVCIEEFHCKSFPIYAAGKMKEGIEHFNQKLGDKGMQPCAILMPLAYKDFSMIAIWPAKDNKWDGIFDSWGSLMKDAHNWPKMAEGHCHLAEKSIKFCRPFNADMIPKEA